MKLRLLTLSLISALVALPIVQAQDAKKEPETELGAQMDKMNGAWRALGRQITDAAKNEDSLAKIATIKASLAASLKFEPAKKADLPAAEQAKFVADYQAKMKEFSAIIAKVETALKAGDNAAAAKALDEAKAAQRDDHKAFKKDSKKKAP
jgi:hypothetical protein